MKLLSKRTKVQYIITNPISQTDRFVDPEDYLDRWQARKIGSRPDLILQFAHFLADEAKQMEYPEVEVRANVMQSLNNHDFKPFIDPGVNLATKPRTLASKPWVLPLHDSLVMEPTSDYTSNIENTDAENRVDGE